MFHSETSCRGDICMRPGITCCVIKPAATYAEADVQLRMAVGSASLMSTSHESS